MFNIQLTEDQVNMISHSLREMGYKRLDQGIERRDPTLKELADTHFKLAETVYQSLSNRD
jgi:hypothetical protein